MLAGVEGLGTVNIDISSQHFTAILLIKDAHREKTS